MRCSVRSMPARLSSPKTPIWSMTWAMSASVTSRSRRSSSPVVKRASGRRPRSITTSSRSVRFATVLSRATISGGNACIRASRSSVVSRRSTCRLPPCQPSPCIAGTIAGWRTWARTSRTRSVTRPIGSKPVASAARMPADSYVRTGDRMPGTDGVAANPGQRRSQETRAVDAVADQEAQVVRAAAAGAVLREASGPLLGRQQPGVDLAEVEQRVQRGARHDRLVPDRPPSRRRRSPRCGRSPAAWRGSTGRRGARRPGRRPPGGRGGRPATRRAARCALAADERAEPRARPAQLLGRRATRSPPARRP